MSFYNFLKFQFHQWILNFHHFSFDSSGGFRIGASSIDDVIPIRPNLNRLSPIPTLRVTFFSFRFRLSPFPDHSPLHLLPISIKWWRHWWTMPPLVKVISKPRKLEGFIWYYIDYCHLAPSWAPSNCKFDWITQPPIPSLKASSTTRTRSWEIHFFFRQFRFSVNLISLLSVFIIKLRTFIESFFAANFITKNNCQIV